MPSTATLGPSRPGQWTVLARMRAYRQDKGPDKCRTNAHGIGVARRQLEMMLLGPYATRELAEMQEELAALESECRMCSLFCKLARK